VLVFYEQYLTFWEQWLKKFVSCHLRESIDIDVLFYGSWGEPCLIRIGNLKKYDNVTRALRQRRKLVAQSTLNLEKSQMQDMNVE